MTPLQRDPAAGRRGTWDRFGLGRPELRAWALYDCANSAAVTSIVTAIFPVYFAKVAAAGVAGEPTSTYAIATTVGLTVVAALSPLLGAVADVRPWKKRLLAGFAFAGCAGTAALWFVGRGDVWLASTLMVLVTVGLNGSFVFYDALLPHVARPDELDRVSSAGYVVGYLGGGVLLAAQLALIQHPGWLGLPPAGTGSAAQATLPTRLAFLTTAAWWALFTVPLLRRVPEPAVAAAGPPGAAIREAMGRLGHTLVRLRAHRQALLLLAAFLLYNDGIGTIIRMATVYGAEMKLSDASLIQAILLVQFIGIPAGYGFVAVAGWIGTKRSILAGLAVYTVVAILAYGMKTERDFTVLAVLVGLVQGGTQALSRSLFASVVPRHLSGEFFGFFSVFEKVAGLFGPAFFALAIALTGSSRGAILSVIVFFAAGAILLARVDVEAGRREAEAADAAAGQGLPTSRESGAPG